MKYQPSSNQNITVVEGVFEERFFIFDVGRVCLKVLIKVFSKTCHANIFKKRAMVKDFTSIVYFNYFYTYWSLIDLSHILFSLNLFCIQETAIEKWIKFKYFIDQRLLTSLLHILILKKNCYNVKERISILTGFQWFNLYSDHNDDYQIDLNLYNVASFVAIIGDFLHNQAGDHTLVLIPTKLMAAISTFNWIILLKCWILYR